MGIVVLMFYGWDNSAQGSHGGDGTVVLRVYGGDRGAQGLWWGYQCSGSMVGIGSAQVLWLG